MKAAHVQLRLHLNNIVSVAMHSVPQSVSHEGSAASLKLSVAATLASSAVPRLVSPSPPPPPDEPASQRAASVPVSRGCSVWQQRGAIPSHSRWRCETAHAFATRDSALPPHPFARWQTDIIRIHALRYQATLRDEPFRRNRTPTYPTFIGSWRDVAPLAPGFFPALNRLSRLTLTFKKYFDLACEYPLQHDVWHSSRCRAGKLEAAPPPSPLKKRA